MLINKTSERDLYRVIKVPSGRVSLNLRKKINPTPKFNRSEPQRTNPPPRARGGDGCLGRGNGNAQAQTTCPMRSPPAPVSAPRGLRHRRPPISLHVSKLNRGLRSMPGHKARGIQGWASLLCCNLLGSAQQPLQKRSGGSSPRQCSAANPRPPSLPCAWEMRPQKRRRGGEPQRPAPGLRHR